MPIIIGDAGKLSQAKPTDIMERIEEYNANKSLEDSFKDNVMIDNIVGVLASSDFAEILM